MEMESLQPPTQSESTELASHNESTEAKDTYKWEDYLKAHKNAHPGIVLSLEGMSMYGDIPKNHEVLAHKAPLSFDAYDLPKTNVAQLS